MQRRNNKGITLIALVITIIIMLILAGVALSLTIGENSLIKLAKKAGSEYKNEQENEIKDLDKLYSSIKIAGDSQITLSKEQLDEYIKSKMAGNSVGIDTVDTYTLSKFSITAGGTEKSMLSGNSKFGTIDNEGNLVFDMPGWYYVSSSYVINPDPLIGQVYNHIYVNDQPLIYSFTYHDESAAPVCATFYANRGDKLKIKLSVRGTSNSTKQPIWSWTGTIYKMY